MFKRHSQCIRCVLAAFLLTGAFSQASSLPWQPVDMGLDEILDDSGITGGFIVQVGMGPCISATPKAQQPSFLVQRLLADADQLKSVRSDLFNRTQYGRVSAIEWAEKHLPYPDGKINLLILSGDRVNLPDSEIHRALAPLGTAYRYEQGTWIKYQKPWTGDLDHWTHARYDSTGNAVSKDQLAGTPGRLQWYAAPRWNRGVKTSSMVSAGGRIFYILDDSRFDAEEESWSLIARDAFSGVMLWRREFPSWAGARYNKKVGPIQTDRQLIASEDHVVVPLHEGAPASILDAGSGESLHVLEHTRSAEELILSDGVLVILANPNTPADIRRGLQDSKTIFAHDIETAEILWQHSVEQILPTTLAADRQHVVFHNGHQIVNLDLRTGTLRWESAPTQQRIVYEEDPLPPGRPGARDSTIIINPQFAPTLMIYNDVVAFAGGGQVHVVSSEDGRELWRNEFALSNYSIAADMFGFNDLIWGPDRDMDLWRPRDDSLNFIGYDLKTGEIKKSLQSQYGFRFQHHRCHQMKAVGDVIMAARAGIEFLDTTSGQVQPHHWVRGSCHYGVMPANGLLYVPPHNCVCYVRAKLSGFFAFRDHENRPANTEVVAEKRLVEGPAFNQTAPLEDNCGTDDWPTYRHDPARSGRSQTAVEADLRKAWKTHIGGNLTPPVIAEGRVFVAATEKHQLFALDAASGHRLWEYTASGRIDSPPTLYNGLVLFGSRDGWVYALRASDGILAWRFRAAPEELWVVSDGQVESVWPVHGSLLVVDDILYFSSGRSSYIDGGIHLFGLDPQSGEMLFHTRLDSRQIRGCEEVIREGLDDKDIGVPYAVKHGDQQTVDEHGIDGYLNDILSSNGESLFMRAKVFDLECNPTNEHVTHLQSPDGYLSDLSTPRLLWTYAPMYTSTHQGAHYNQDLSRVFFPSGRILIEGKEMIFGFGDNDYENISYERNRQGSRTALFASPKRRVSQLEGLTASQLRFDVAKKGDMLIEFEWWREVPIEVWGMIQAQDHLFIAGPGTTVATRRTKTASSTRHGFPEDVFSGKTSGTLIVVSPADGRPIAEVTIPSTPVWDGMAAAHGHIFISMRDGSLLCLKGGSEEPSGNRARSSQRESRFTSTK